MGRRGTLAGLRDICNLNFSAVSVLALKTPALRRSRAAVDAA
jgi:hypothetical protein